MSKFLVTSGSAFTPFTYDELVAPLKDMATAHNAAQDAYDTLSTETALLERYITDNPEDAKAKKMYTDYMTKLNSLQQNLWNNGYTSTTRQDLSAAKNGYASDISRIASAVKTRQERSAEYNKMKREHPDLVMGNDPGLAGLDAYLDNDLYGQDYFTYSGKSFADEVGAELKARGNERIRKAEIERNPELVGYIQQKMHDGFTNSEVDNAMAFVRGILNTRQPGMSTNELLDIALNEIDNGGQNTGLDDVEQILAGALISRLKSTGAADNISDSEFDRLVGYGGIGLAQGIGKTTEENLKDLEWEQRQKVALENLNHQHRMAEKAPTGGIDTGEHNYEIPSFYMRVQGADADEKVKKYGDYFGKVSKDNPLDVKIDGEWHHAETPEEATKLLYNNEFHASAMEDYGFDTSLSSNKKQEHQIEYTYSDGTSEILDIRTNGTDKNGRVIVEFRRPGSKWTVWDEATDNYNYYRDKDIEYRKKIEEENGIKLSDYDNKPKDEKRFKDDFNIDDPSGRLREYYRPIAEIKTSLGTYRPSVLAGPDNEAALESYAREIANSYYLNKPSNKKDNHFAFYALGLDNKIKEKNKVSFEDVFVLDDAGQIKNGNLFSISGLPELLLEGPGYLIVTTSKGKFAMDAHMLDTALGSALYGDGSIGLVGAVESLMSPFTHPEDTFRSGKDEDEKFTDTVMSIFDGGYLERRGTYGAKMKDIMADRAARDEYYGQIVELMHATFAAPREVLGLLNYQTRGKTSAKAMPMFGKPVTSTEE